MRVLIVDAFSGSKTGREAFSNFERLVRSSFKKVELQEEGCTQYIVRHFTKGLEEFCYDNESAEFASKGAIAAVDKLDFIVIDGDCRLLPWHSRTLKLAILVRTVLGAKKCLLAAGPGAYMVAYVCATGGRMLRVLNGGGQGGSLLDLAGLRPEDLGGINGTARSSDKGKEVVLDSATGDFYAFDAKSDRWLAEGNVGILKTGAGLGGVAAAILADACGNVEGYGNEPTLAVTELLVRRRESQGATDISTKALGRPNTPRFQSEVLVRLRPTSIQNRMFKHVLRGEYLAWSPGAWSLGERTAARCRRGFTVLASSARAGPEVVEVDNCLATRYNLRRAYEDSVMLIEAFVTHKCATIREINRKDRSTALILNWIGGNPDDDAGKMGDDVHSKNHGASAGSSTCDPPLGLFTLPTLPQLSPRTDTVRTSNGRQQETMFVRCLPLAFPGKPRFAPPQSTRAIRAGKQPRPTHGMGQLTHAAKANRNLSSVVDGKVEGDGFVDRERADCRVMARAADPAGRRRVLMTMMGQGFGLDLSSAINVLLLQQQGDQQPHPQESEDEKPDTARTAPAAPGRRTGKDTGGFDPGFDGLGKNENEQHGWHVREEAQEANRLEESGFGSRGEEWETHGEQETVAAVASRNLEQNEFRLAAFTARRKRSDGRNAIRIPGHDIKKPYSSFRRFKKMAEETRSRFFSVSCDSGSTFGDTPRGRKPYKSRRERGRQLHNSGVTTQPRFRATFVEVEAWPMSKSYGVATEGPYYGKCSGRPGETESDPSLLLDPTGWKHAGGKTRAWFGIGEGNFKK